MAKPINMPQVGQDLETAIITEWCVAENESIKKGDILAVVESDKASFEVETFEPGTVIKLLYNVGDVAKVPEPIAYIGEPGEVLDEPGESSSAMVESSLETDDVVKEETVELVQSNKKVISSPVARRMAKENGIYLTSVKGTGPNERIGREDVQRAIDEKGSQINNLAEKSASESHPVG